MSPRPVRSPDKAVVGQLGEGMQSGLERVLDADQVHLVAVEVEARLLHFRARFGDGLAEPARPAGRTSSLRDLELVERDDVHVRQAGVGDAVAAQVVLQNGLLLQQVGLGGDQILLAE